MKIKMWPFKEKERETYVRENVEVELEYKVINRLHLEYNAMPICDDRGINIGSAYFHIKGLVDVEHYSDNDRVKRFMGVHTITEHDLVTAPFPASDTIDQFKSDSDWTVMEQDNGICNGFSVSGHSFQTKHECFLTDAKSMQEMYTDWDFVDGHANPLSRLDFLGSFMEYSHLLNKVREVDNE
jgi:hypothetical protein